MATSAENQAEVGISSDELDRHLLCKPCREEGETLTAVGFCVNCSEHLCQQCYDGHLIPSITRKHVLKRHEKEHSTEAVESKYSCQQHRNKDIEYHCPTHSFLGCHVCFFRHHKSCKDVIFIPDFTISASGSGECDTFYQKLNSISTKCTDYVSEIKGNLETIPCKHSDIITALREFKQEILDMIEALEKELIEKIDGQQKKEIKRMEELSVKCETLLKEVRQMSATVEMLQNKDQDRELYIERVQSENKVINMQEQVKLIEKDKNVSMPVYKPNKDVAEYLKKPSSLGSLDMKSPVIKKLKHEREINCRFNTSSCMLLGSVILPGQKLVVINGHKGNTVRLIDITQNKIQSDLNLSSNTFGICKITDTSVAVTLTDHKKITFIKIGATLSVEREISVNFVPSGIDHLDNILVVSYRSPHKVEIINIQGKVIRTFTTCENGQVLFNHPSHVAINPVNKHIYVSNMGSYNVVCMDMDGNVVATYDDYKLKIPRQVIFDSSGMVYICGQGSNNVHQITEDCQKVKVILTKKDGLINPFSICYDEENGFFYIGETCHSILKLYKAVYTQI